MNKTNEISAYLRNISLLLLGILMLAFPLVFTMSTTDWFVLPKQILLGFTVLTILVLFGAKMISDGAVRLRRTPFDLPIFLFAIALLASSVFAVNRFDSLISFVPFLFAVVGYFMITNFVKNKSSIMFLVVAFIIGACILSIIATLSFFKFYPLPLDFTHVQSFSPLGSILDQVVYLALAFPIGIYFMLSLLKVKDIGHVKGEEVGFAISSLIILVGLIISIYELLVLKPQNSGLPILPFEAGFQTAFAAISQDAGRIAQGFFFGSGFGTYVTDFTRFKQAAFNQNPALWSLTFFRSSSFVLEILATTGFLGLGALIFLVINIAKELKTAKNILVASLILTLIAIFILPLSFITQAVIFLLLGIFAALQGIGNGAKQNKFFDIELHFVASKKGIPISSFPISNDLAVGTVEAKNEERTYTKILPVISFILFGALAIIIAIPTVLYVTSDVIFQNSVVAATNNNGLQTYNDQVNAIKIFPYRDAYYRIYSQTNLALANSLAASLPKNSSPSAQTQQTIYTLIQQSINSARTATSTSPQTALNWQNLSTIYRSLIGFGQNAESFALLSMQQSIMLDPNNPQNYLNAGGIYYQLNQWEPAQRQFQIAVNLKPDFANAYYNLGHALEAKGDLQGALVQYQTVKSLMANDQNNAKKITEEIDVLQKKIGSANEVSAQTNEKQPVSNQPDLGISTPSQQLPKQKTEVEIPSPQATATPTPAPTPSPTPSAAPTINP